MNFAIYAAFNEAPGPRLDWLGGGWIRAAFAPLRPDIAFPAGYEMMLTIQLIPVDSILSLIIHDVLLRSTKAFSHGPSERTCLELV